MLPHMDYTVNSVLDMPFRALGGQPPFEAGDLASFLKERRIAVVSYIRKDGRPSQAPLWYGFDQGHLVMTIATGSAKHLAFQRDNRVCVTIQDERPPYRACIIDGTLEMTELPRDGNDELGYELAVRYFGKATANEYWKMTEEDREENGRTVLRLIPAEVKGFDNTKALSKALLAGVRLRELLPIPRGVL